MKQQLTKQQAIDEMKNGNKVTHRFFGPDEWVTMQGNIMRMEQGQECWASQFWKDREGPEWEYNWELFAAPTPSSTEPEQESEALRTVEIDLHKAKDSIDNICILGAMIKDPEQREYLQKLNTFIADVWDKVLGNMKATAPTPPDKEAIGEHTPGPWLVVNQGKIPDAEGNLVCIRSGASNGYIAQVEASENIETKQPQTPPS